MAVTKPDGSIRPVLIVSAPASFSFNDGIDRDLLWPACMDTCRSVVYALQSAGPQALMSKKDLSNAYKLIPVPLQDRRLQVFSWLGKYFVEINSIFGAASSGANFDKFHNHLLNYLVMSRCQIPRHLVLRAVDNVPVIAPDGSPWLEQFNTAYEDVCSYLNITVSPNSPMADKAFHNTRRGVIFGILYDTTTATWQFPEGKRLRFLHDILDVLPNSQAQVSTLESLCGKVLNFCQLFPVSQFYKAELIQIGNSVPHDNESGQPVILFEDRARIRAHRNQPDVWLPLSPLLKGDLHWWAMILHLNRAGYPLPSLCTIPPLNCLYYTSDAAGPDVDSLFCRDVGVAWIRYSVGDLPMFLSVLRWPTFIQLGLNAPDGKSIGYKLTTLEMVGVLLPFLTDGHAVAGCSVVCYTDNVGTVYAWRKGHTVVVWC